MLVSILGESKQGGYDKSVSQYQFNCPWCADEKGSVDNKYNLEISFALGKLKQLLHVILSYFLLPHEVPFYHFQYELLPKHC